MEVQADVEAGLVEDLPDTPWRGHTRGVGEGDVFSAGVAGAGTSSATSSGVICSPSNGEPKQHEITTSSTASDAAARMSAMPSSAFSIDWRMFFSL